MIYFPIPIFIFFNIAATLSLEIPDILPVARVPVHSTAIFNTCLRILDDTIPYLSFFYKHFHEKYKFTI